MAFGIAAHEADLVEEAFAGAAILVERGRERAFLPAPVCAPGRVQHHVVEAGAERVVRRAHLVHRDLGFAGAALELADLAGGTVAHVALIGRGGGVVQSGEQLQQRLRGGDQRVAEGADEGLQVGAAGDRRRLEGARPIRSRNVCRGGVAPGRHAGGGARASRHRPDDGAVILGFGKWIVAHRPSERRPL